MRFFSILFRASFRNCAKATTRVAQGRGISSPIRRKHCMPLPTYRRNRHDVHKGDVVRFERKIGYNLERIGYAKRNRRRISLRKKTVIPAAAISEARTGMRKRKPRHDPHRDIAFCDGNQPFSAGRRLKNPHRSGSKLRLWGIGDKPVCIITPCRDNNPAICGP